MNLSGHNSVRTLELLKTSLMTDPILTYPDPNHPYVLFTDATKYAWACAITQVKIHTIGEKKLQYYTLLLT